MVIGRDPRESLLPVPHFPDRKKKKNEAQRKKGTYPV
jgi:hypothetical protein